MKNNYFFKKRFSNIYKNASKKSEVTSQILYGEKFNILSKRKKWIKRKDIKNISHKEKNFNKIFKLFLKTKYVWGGKTYEGIDCSALLQMFYYYNQSFYPRDTVDQIKYSKRKVTKKIFKNGDIIFWKGHVAICLNSKKLIHAYGPEKKVLIMPILETISRIEKTAKLVVKKISSIRN